MGRRRIWLIIIGILIAGVFATWAMERFVSSHGVDTAAVVGFEADALLPDTGNTGNPYRLESRMKIAENTPAAQSFPEAQSTPAAQNAPAQAENSADNGIMLYQAETGNDQEAENSGETSESIALKKEAAADVSDAAAGILTAGENDLAAEDGEKAKGSAVQEAGEASAVETESHPLEPDDTSSGNTEESKLTIEYTRSELEERLETARAEAEKYQDDQAMSQTSRYAAAEYVMNLWDRELNLIYSSIHREMDEDAAEALRREELEWIRKRDLAADMASPKSSGTPSQSIEYVRMSASMTMDRCYELLEDYGDYLESEKSNDDTSAHLNT